MSEIFETNELAYRTCILYEVLNKNPLKEAYEKMKTVKPDIDYSDFEYWYFRFSNGRHDLKHDRSTDPNLFDMPINVMENILKNLGLVDKLSARKVCRNMRTVIDNQTSKFDRLCLIIRKKYCVIRYEDLRIRYSAMENGNYLLRTPRETISLKGDYSMMAMREFASMITHPKWKYNVILIQFKLIDCDPEYERKSVLFLNYLLSNHQIHVEGLRIDGRTFEPLATLLPLFEAKNLGLHFGRLSDDARTSGFDVIAEMNQWKNLTVFEITDLPDGFPIEAFFHAERYHVENSKLTEDRLVKIRDILFKAPVFERFKFCDRKYDNREELSVLTDRVMGAHSAYDPHTKIYRIEDSKDYIQIFIKGVKKNALRIQRIRS